MRVYDTGRGVLVYRVKCVRQGVSTIKKRICEGSYTRANNVDNVSSIKPHIINASYIIITPYIINILPLSPVFDMFTPFGQPALLDDAGTR